MFRPLFAIGLALWGQSASAQDLIERYTAYISWNDLFNSANARLTEPWQIVRQDRANFHRFGIRDAGDDGDSFFADAGNREAAERMIMNGYISPAAANAIVNGDVLITVEIWGHGSVGDYINIEVH